MGQYELLMCGGMLALTAVLIIAAFSFANNQKETNLEDTNHVKHNGCCFKIHGRASRHYLQHPGRLQPPPFPHLAAIGDA